MDVTELSVVLLSKKRGIKIQRGLRMSLDTGNIAVTSPSHICGVVKDMDKAIEFFSSVFGVGPWHTEEFCPPKDDMIVGESF